MRDSLKAIFFFHVCAFCFINHGILYAQIQKNGGDKIPIAVLEFEGKGISQLEASTLTDRLRSYLVASGSFLVIERGKMDEILKEQGFQLSGCVSSECAVEVGELLGVRRMITGGIGKIGKTFTLDVRVIDIESGEIIESVSLDYTGEIDGLLGEIRTIAKKLSGGEEVEPTPLKVKEALANLTLATIPIGATVYIDGIKLGLTPTNLGEVKAGKHSLRFTKSGYIDKETDITIEPGESKVVTVDLERLNIIEVTSKPKGAEIYINDKLEGNTPVKVTLRSGTYSFRLESENYDVLEESVRIYRDWKYKLTLLKLIQVEFKSDPIGAGIYMNNKYVGTTDTTATVAEGKYSVVFRKRNFKDVILQKDIRKNTRISTNLEMTDDYKVRLTDLSAIRKKRTLSSKIFTKRNKIISGVFAVSGIAYYTFYKMGEKNKTGTIAIKIDLPQ